MRAFWHKAVTNQLSWSWQGNYPSMTAPLSLTRAAERPHTGSAMRSALRRVAKEDKAAVYAQATAFLFPSLYEGFGMMILEAMATGTRSSPAAIEITASR